MSILSAAADNTHVLPDGAAYLQKLFYKFVHREIASDLHDFVTSIDISKPRVADDLDGIAQDLLADTALMWLDCHPSIRPNWLEAVATVRKAAPDFDLSRLVALSRNLHATTLKVLYYPTYQYAKGIRRVGQVQDSSNSSIKFCMTKAGISSAVDDDLCFMRPYTYSRS